MIAATTYRLKADPRLRVVTADEILIDVEAHPDAEPVTDADWHWFLPGCPRSAGNTENLNWRVSA